MKLFKIGLLLLSSLTVFTVNGYSEIPKKVKVSSNDTTAGFLNGKLVAGSNISFTEGNDGGNEILTIAATGGGTGTLTTLKESNVQVGDADIGTLDFGSGFDIAESPDTEINITLDLSEIVTGDVTYTANVANVTEADALAINGTDCTAGRYARGVDAAGVAEFCTDATIEIDSVVATHTANSSAHHTATVNTDNQNLFETINTTSGTSPVADSATDTLTLTAGANITITGNSSTDTVTIASTGGGYSTVEDEGTPLTQRSVLNFTGAGVTCVDDAGSPETDCDIPGAGSATSTVEESDVSVSTVVTNFDFRSGFDIAESPSGEANIDLDLSEIVTGDVSYTGNVSAVGNDSHDHTTTTISGLDVSDDLNLIGGTNITLTGDTLNVDDAFLLNTGDIGTGAYDFGGADSLEAVNAFAPTIDATGEFAIDTTNDQWVYFASATTRVLDFRKQIDFTLESPADADNFNVWKPQYAITVTDIECLVDPADSAESVIITMEERDSNGDTPAGLDGATTITCGNTTTSDDGTLSNGSVDADDYVSVDIGTVTGTVTQLSVRLKYTIDST